MPAEFAGLLARSAHFIALVSFSWSLIAVALLASHTERLARPGLLPSCWQLCCKPWPTKREGGRQHGLSPQGGWGDTYDVTSIPVDSASYRRPLVTNPFNCTRPQPLCAAFTEIPEKTNLMLTVTTESQSSFVDLDSSSVGRHEDGLAAIGVFKTPYRVCGVGSDCSVSDSAAGCVAAVACCSWLLAAAVASAVVCCRLTGDRDFTQAPPHIQPPPGFCHTLTILTPGLQTQPGRERRGGARKSALPALIVDPIDDAAPGGTTIATWGSDHVE